MCRKARLVCLNVVLVVQMSFSQEMKENKSVKVSLVVHNVCLVWRNANQCFFAPTHTLCALQWAIKDERYLYHGFSHSKLCHNQSFFLLDSVVLCQKNLNFFCCAVQIMVVALDSIEYCGLMKAAASYSTCLLRLDDLKALILGLYPAVMVSRQ